MDVDSCECGAQAATVMALWNLCRHVAGAGRFREWRNSGHESGDDQHARGNC